MISEYLRSIVRCPQCYKSENSLTPPLETEREGMLCPACKRLYAECGQRGYLDLRPPADKFETLTDYAEEEFYHREGELKPLFLSARIKMDMMVQMLQLSSRDRVLDIGCGKGQFLYYSRPTCGQLVGIDAGAHFAAEPLATVDLTRGDIRSLPFADGSFDKAYSLDVLEHLDAEGVHDMLTQARRVLRPGGKLFLYSHVMMSSRIASFQRGVNRLIQWLDAKGLVDNEPERNRKSDHQNALGSYEQLDTLLKESGFRIAKIRYYNVFFKAIFEDLVLPLIEHNFFRNKETVGSNHSEPHVHGESTKPDVGRWAHTPMALASYIMKLDVFLFGRVRTGPFFLLLEAI